MLLNFGTHIGFTTLWVYPKITIVSRDYDYGSVYARLSVGGCYTDAFEEDINVVGYLIKINMHVIFHNE